MIRDKQSQIKKDVDSLYKEVDILSARMANVSKVDKDKHTQLSKQRRHLYYLINSGNKKIAKLEQDYKRFDRMM
jgi:hypothetical protein